MNSIKAVKPTLYLTIGVPGSGKSTAVNKMALQNQSLVVINTDAIREEITGDPMDQTHNNEVWNIAYGRISHTLEYGHSAVVDATHSLRSWRERDITMYRGFREGIIVVGLYFNTTIKECLSRNNNRNRVVPATSILRMYEALQLEPPSTDEGFDEIIEFNSGH
jgi:predicted kinase